MFYASIVSNDLFRFCCHEYLSEISLIDLLFHKMNGNLLCIFVNVSIQDSSMHITAMIDSCGSNVAIHGVITLASGEECDANAIGSANFFKGFLNN